MLVVITDDKGTENTVERKWNVDRIKDEYGQFVACYFFPISDYFFFFKQKTAYEMIGCDWSSDVCSSDLRPTLITK